MLGSRTGRLVIRIENSCYDVESDDEDDFLSSKGAEDGVGLESVRMVVERYQGCLSCRRHENAFIFSAVLFPLPS